MATSTPYGYFFLPSPPDEPLPIPDFRTVTDVAISRPSADLLDTIYLMQRRQVWLREALIEEGVEPLGFVGTATLNDDPDAIAQEMRGLVGLGDGWAQSVSSWTQAVGELRRAIEEIGVMAVINGVVDNNTHRRLDVNEFRGFALSDEYAPLIFVNGADWESAKMFTLAHELAHIWLGRGALSGYKALIPTGNDVEVFCNKVAAEFLVPARQFRDFWPTVRTSSSPFEAAAKRFKVSPIVAARRAMDLRIIDRNSFFSFYEKYVAAESKKARELKAKGKSGGDFYNNQNTRVGVHFATAVICAAKEGRLLYRDAYKLTGLYGTTFAKYAERLGFGVR